MFLAQPKPRPIARATQGQTLRLPLALPHRRRNQAPFSRTNLIDINKLKNTLILSALAILPAIAGNHGNFLEPANYTGETGTPDHSSHHHHHLDTPIGVMGGHIHRKGDWMASYRYMYMDMEQNFNGDSTVGNSSVLQDFVVTPVSMEMQMHMFGLMYGATDKLTLMGMLTLAERKMDHVTRAGQSFTTRSSGLGDSSVGALYQLFSNDTQSLHVGLQVLLPSAGIDERDDTPLGRTQLPYPMQLGSGSWGVSPSITWTGHRGNLSYGAQASAKFHLAENDNDYRLGNSYQGTVWGSHRWTDYFATSLRVTVSRWEDIHGADPDITTTPPMGPLAGTPLVPTADPDLRGGTRIDVSLGANFRIPKTGATFGVEGTLPVYQELDGPQLGSEWSLTAGIQFVF